MQDASGDTHTQTPGGEAQSRQDAAQCPADGSAAADGSTSALRLLVTPRWIAFTVTMLAAVTACLLLARWQYDRFESVSGTWQNLGYTLQWPFFAAFAVYVWWRLLRDSAAPTEPREQTGRTANAQPDTSADETGGPPENGRSDKAAVKATPARASSLQVGSSGSAATGSRRSPTGGSVIAGQRETQEDDDPELAAYNDYLAALNRRSPT